MLVPFTLPGGLGAHKWLDRTLLDELTAEARRRSGAATATPLLLDGAGDVLEAAWAAVFASEQDTLLTPRADGRILPSISRARMLAAARAANRSRRTRPRSRSPASPPPTGSSSRARSARCRRCSTASPETRNGPPLARRDGP